MQNKKTTTKDSKSLKLVLSILLLVTTFTSPLMRAEIEKENVVSETNFSQYPYFDLFTENATLAKDTKASMPYVYAAVRVGSYIQGDR